MKFSSNKHSKCTNPCISQSACSSATGQLLVQLRVENCHSDAIEYHLRAAAPMEHKHYVRVSGETMVRASLPASETGLICETAWKCTPLLSFPASVLKSILEYKLGGISAHLVSNSSWTPYLHRMKSLPCWWWGALGWIFSSNPTLPCCLQSTLPLEIHSFSTTQESWACALVYAFSQGKKTSTVMNYWWTAWKCSLQHFFFMRSCS